MYLWIIAILVLAWSIYYWWDVKQFSKRKLPFSWPIPLIGNNGSLILQREVFSEQILNTYNRFKGHPFAGTFEFSTRVIMIRDPEVIKYITVKDFDHFTDHRTTIPEGVEPILGRNLVCLKGQEWKTARNTLSPAFTSSKMKFMFQLVSECGKQLTRYVDGQLQKPDCEVLKLEMKDVFTKFTNDVIATAAFGIKCNSLEQTSNKFYEMGRKATSVSGKTLVSFFAYLVAPKLMKMLKVPVLAKDATSFFKQLIHDTIRTREDKNIIRPDMIHLLLEAKKGQTDLSNDDIVAQAFIFFAAGFETSSALMCFSTMLLAMHPEVQKKLQEEIDEVFNYKDQTITYEALQGMTYLDMVISETLRLYPPTAATDRKCVKTYRVPAAENRPELTIQKGEYVSIPIISLHRDPDYFPDPERFQPERFSEENKNNIKPYTYLPFGVGPRSCIGNRFALMQSKTALVNLLSKFNLNVIEETPLPIKLTNSMNVEGGSWVGLTRRQKSTYNT